MAGTDTAQASPFELQQPLLDSFVALTKQIEDKIHLFATEGGDERLSQVALDVTKQLFDLGVGLEEHSHAHIQPFIAAIAQPTGIALRSSSKKGKQEEEPKATEPEDLLPHTPLSELTTDGLEHEQVWQQMELRAPGYVRVAKEITAGEGADDDEGAMGMDEVELSESGSEAGSDDDDEEMTEEEFREMLAEQGMDDLTDEEIAKMMEDAENSDVDSDDDDEEDSEGDSEEDMMSGSENEDEEDEVEFEDGTRIGGSDDDDEELELGSGEDENDIDMDDDDEEEEDEDAEDGSDVDADDDEEEDDDVPGPSSAGPSKRRQRQHPTLDDQFFSIDDFNRTTEEAEATQVTSGRLNDDQEEDEDLDEDVGDVMLKGADEDEPIMYGDFFDAPRTIQKPPSTAKANGGKDKAKGKGKGKGKQARFTEEEDEEVEDEEEEAREVMGRFKEDLFADDDEDAQDQPVQALSTHERRQRQLEEQIAQLEQEAVGPKEWTLLGEASARARPENSLLEQDLDFEHVQKVTPVITEETVRTLEELIKKRILDNDFNSTVRVRAYEPTPFLPSRYLDLQDTQSSKSLAQIYEEEYQSAAGTAGGSGGKAVDARDAKLQKDHQEIDDLWTEICYKLDALSSLNFVPKQPKAQITTISNLPTTSMETALPAASSTSTMLAPEEMFQPATQASLVARSELTPEEAQRQRERKRKAKKQERKHLGDMAELYGKGAGGGKKRAEGGTKGEKERALAGLVKSGKGVTVVGKSDKEAGRAIKRVTTIHPSRPVASASASASTSSAASGARSNGQQQHHNQHHHHRKIARPRSVSRSSSSPSPPPAAISRLQQPYREKRKSFTTPANPGVGGSQSTLNRGRTVGASTSASPRPAVAVSSSNSNGHAFDVEPPSPQTATDGFSTHGNGASASASSARGFSEVEEEENRYIGLLGDETEVERQRGDGARSVTPTPPVMERKISPPSGPGASSRMINRRSAPSYGTPVPQRRSVLPLWIGISRAPVEGDKKGKGRAFALPPLGFYLTRRKCEDGLLLGGVASGVWQLGRTWNEIAIAGEIMLLLGLSVVYMTVRGRKPAPTARSPTTVTFARPGSPASLPGSSIRERGSRASHSLGPHHHAAVRDELRRTSPLGSFAEDAGAMIGSKGAVWGTEGREYRDCPDDGALYALLLAPLVAAGLLDAALTQLDAQPDSPLPKRWNIEQPLVLPSTPLRPLPGTIPPLTNAIKALSALATSRRNLVQLFTLCSFVLLVHLARTLHLETKQARLQDAAPAMERENSGPGTGTGPSQGASTSTYWLKRGEWRRTKSVVGFAFLVTLCCLGVKIVTAKIGRGVWSDMSPSDIVIATLFYQFSLYVCIRLARRGFTLGELAVVCNAATALFMETVNMTRMKIRLLRTPYIKTYRLPTPLLTFQLALIPGSLLAGFLLSPLLYLSRHLAQRPAHRLRFPHEKPVHRRLLALGFYAGSALVCGGIVGVWTRWSLGWRDPFVWAAMFVVEGKHWYTRPILLSYWALLAVISVAGWSRQLVRARRHRRYDPPSQPTRAERHMVAAPHQGTSLASAPVALAVPASGPGAGGGQDTNSSGFATMMDAADQRLPTFSVNARRKFFHALAVVMFVPGIAIDPAFTHLSFSVAFALFNFAEYVRYFALWPFGVSVHLFLNEFLDSKDSGTAILSHFYLLAGCASPLWMEGHRDVLSHFGVLSLGIGDALASIVGRRFGRVRWSQTGGKTVEGSVAFFVSVLGSTTILRAFGVVGPFNFWPYALTTALAAVLEAMSDQNDNLILPMFGWAVGTLLGV